MRALQWVLKISWECVGVFLRGIDKCMDFLLLDMRKDARLNIQSSQEMNRRRTSWLRGKLYFNS